MVPSPLMPSFLFGQVCDEPHPLLVKEMIQHCVKANIDEAYKVCPRRPLCGDLHFQLLGRAARGGSLCEGLACIAPLNS